MARGLKAYSYVCVGRIERCAAIRQCILRRLNPDARYRRIWHQYGGQIVGRQFNIQPAFTTGNINSGLTCGLARVNISVGSQDFFCPQRTDPADQISRGALRHHQIGHIDLFAPEALATFQISCRLQASGDGQLLHIAIHGNQKRFIHLIGV